MTFWRMGPVVGLVVFGACATTTPPPEELLSARASFERARTGPAAQVALVDLHAAQQALDRAESSYLSAPDSDATRDLAYVAERRAEIAEAHAAAQVATARRTQAEQQRAQVQQGLYQQAESSLSAARNQLVQQQGALATEHQARQEAEHNAQAALESLRQVATVRDEQRGTVISLSGEVLFAPGQASLLPIAQQRLDQVAQALIDQGTRHLVVEGHTDSRGSSVANQQLSQSRAQAVRDYLIARGVPSGQVEAVGLGASRPVADNGTPDGRATNRRVEIVIAPTSAVGGGPPGAPDVRSAPIVP